MITKKICKVLRQKNQLTKAICEIYRNKKNCKNKPKIGE